MAADLIPHRITGQDIDTGRHDGKLHEEPGDGDGYGPLSAKSTVIAGAAMTVLLVVAPCRRHHCNFAVRLFALAPVIFEDLECIIGSPRNYGAASHFDSDFNSLYHLIIRGPSP